MTETRGTTSEEAKRVGDEIGVDWSRFDLEQFPSVWTSSMSMARMIPRRT